MQKITNQTRTKVNSNLYGLNRMYHKQIPLEGIFDILKSNGLIAIQEDKTEFQGFLCGSEGNTRISFKYSNCNMEISNSVLVLSWYKMTSGNYEINAYIS